MHAAQTLRHAIRAGRDTGLTTGHAAGFVQANLVVLPAAQAPGFLAFCAANPRACPVLGASALGAPDTYTLPALGADIDVRTDLPGYLLHRRGQAPQPVNDLKALWHKGLVAIALGCWFSMEDALRAAGVRLRHVELGIQGPLFKTHLPTVRAGAFGGSPLVVSMRPFASASVDTVRRVTGSFPRVHGAPVHAGDPAVLGITDLHTPDFGEVLLPLDGEVPLFWPCGLTANLALEAAGVEFFITHVPGKMLVTDWRNEQLRDEPPALIAPVALIAPAALAAQGVAGAAATHALQESTGHVH